MKPNKKIYVYQELARRICSVEKNLKIGDFDRANECEVINKILRSYFPSGGGFTGCSINMTQSKNLIFQGSFKVEDGNCFRHKVIEYTVKVSPCLRYRIKLAVTGSFGKKYEDAKDHIYRLFFDTLMEEFDKNITSDSSKIVTPVPKQKKTGKKTFWKVLLGTS